MKNLKIFSIGLILFSSCISYGGVDAPSFINQQCKQFVKSIEQTHVYGWLKVAETPANLDRISVFYYFSKKASLKNPVIFFNGGPGLSFQSYNKSMEDSKRKFILDQKKDIDFIYMDQRGAGCSSAYPVGIDSRTIEKLKWYGSAGIVRDAEELRKLLLGNNKWKIFGQSFGGYVVYRYLEMYPQAISKAYVHGYALGHSDLDVSHARILNHGIVLESYYKIYPSDRKRLIILNKYLSDKNKCFKKENTEVCGFEILPNLVQRIGFKSNWETLHLQIERFVPNDRVSEQAISDFVKQMVRFSDYHTKRVVGEDYFEKYSAALHFIGLYDMNNSALDYEKCLAIYQKMEKESKIKVGESLLDECKAPFQHGYKDQIKPILANKVQVSESNFVQMAKVKSNISKHNISLYVYSGSFDSFIPKSLFQKEVSFLGDSVNYMNFLNSGHEGFMTEAQIFRNLAE